MYGRNMIPSIGTLALVVNLRLEVDNDPYHTQEETFGHAHVFQTFVKPMVTFWQSKPRHGQTHRIAELLVIGIRSPFFPTSRTFFPWG